MKEYIDVTQMYMYLKKSLILKILNLKGVH